MLDNKRTLKSLRVDSGITATHVAKLLGITRQTLYNKENYKSEFTGLEIQKLCEIYNVEISDLKLS